MSYDIVHFKMVCLETSCIDIVLNWYLIIIKQNINHDFAVLPVTVSNECTFGSFFLF